MYFNEAENYEDSSNGHKIIDLLSPKKGMKILDLCCGTGYFSKFLADLVGPESPDRQVLPGSRSGS